MREPSKVCAFTGHRPNKLPWRYDETASGCIALRSVLAEQIGLLAEAGVTQFLSGMAEGVDTWAALEKSRNKAPLHSPLHIAGGEVVSFITEPLPHHSGTGGFDCLCQSGQPQKLYAGPQPLPSEIRRLCAGCLQRGAARRNGSNHTVCSETGTGDYCD